MTEPIDRAQFAWIASGRNGKEGPDPMSAYALSSKDLDPIYDETPRRCDSPGCYTVVSEDDYRDEQGLYTCDECRAFYSLTNSGYVDCRLDAMYREELTAATERVRAA